MKSKHEGKPVTYVLSYIYFPKNLKFQLKDQLYNFRPTEVSGLYKYFYHFSSDELNVL